MDNLKLKIINDFEKFLNRLYKGYKDDYQNILKSINYIDIYSNLDNKNLIYEQLINS